MIGVLKKLFSEPAGNEERSADETRRLAAAALLIEVARADFTQEGNEEEEITRLLQTSLGIERDVIEELLANASEAVDEASSLYEFTRLINDHYSYEEKCTLIEAMWGVAFADQSLHKYEEHLIRNVATLIYVNHEDFIRSKLAAKGSMPS